MPQKLTVQTPPGAWKPLGVTIHLLSVEHDIHPLHINFNYINVLKYFNLKRGGKFFLFSTSLDYISVKWNFSSLCSYFFSLFWCVCLGQRLWGHIHWYLGFTPALFSGDLCGIRDQTGISYVQDKCLPVVVFFQSPFPSFLPSLPPFILPSFLLQISKTGGEDRVITLLIMK